MAAEQGSLGAGHEIRSIEIIVKWMKKYRLRGTDAGVRTVDLRNASLQPAVKLTGIFAAASAKTGCNLSEQAV